MQKSIPIPFEKKKNHSVKDIRSVQTKFISAKKKKKKIHFANKKKNRENYSGKKQMKQQMNRFT